jgi:hypothetical protein
MKDATFRCGDFIWCVKIHEDELYLAEENVCRQKLNGIGKECVNWYEISGKRRIGLVLWASEKFGEVIVWYTRNHDDPAFKPPENLIDVTEITRPRDPKRSFLYPDSGYIRRIPRTATWCGPRKASLDKSVFDGFLKKAEMLRFVRV